VIVFIAASVSVTAVVGLTARLARSGLRTALSIRKRTPARCKRARRPEGVTSLDDRHARREAADHDVHESAREETETRERVRDSLLRSLRLRRHARDSRRSLPRFRIRCPLNLQDRHPTEGMPQMLKSGPDR
jgi:hypothetical protein